MDGRNKTKQQQAIDNEYCNLKYKLLGYQLCTFGVGGSLNNNNITGAELLMMMGRCYLSASASQLLAGGRVLYYLGTVFARSFPNELCRCLANWRHSISHYSVHRSM